MPIKFSVTNTIGNAIKYSNELEKQIPYAHKSALNDLAFVIRRKLVSVSEQKLDKPTPYILKSFRVKKATFSDLSISVGTSDDKRLPYWKQVFDGGLGVPRVLESILRRANDISSNEYLVGSKRLKRNKYGNVLGGYWGATEQKIRLGRAKFIRGRGRSRGAIYDFGNNKSKRKTKTKTLFLVRPLKYSKGKIDLDRVADKLLKQYPTYFNRRYEEKLAIARRRLKLR